MKLALMKIKIISFVKWNLADQSFYIDYEMIPAVSEKRWYNVSLSDTVVVVSK